MAAHTITISVSNNTIELSSTQESVNPGDTITWSTTNATYSFSITFPNWPFTETQETIAVSNGSNGGPYTVHAVTANEVDNYTVAAMSDRRDDPPTTQGEIDVMRP